MKRSVFMIIILLFNSAFLFSQTDRHIPRHGLAAHIGGVFSLYECEYQYRFLVNDNHAFSATFGINSAAIDIGFPVGINYTYGTKNQLLLGIRFVPAVLLLSFDEEVDIPSWNYFANLRIGYGREMTLFNETATVYVYASPGIDLDRLSVFPWAGIGLVQYF